MSRFVYVGTSINVQPARFKGTRASQQTEGIVVLVGSCDCGAVTADIPELPSSLNACPCSFCRKAGARWAYYQADRVTVSGTTAVYLRAARRLEFHRCVTCGMLVYWKGRPNTTANMGVNGNMLDPQATANVLVKVGD